MSIPIVIGAGVFQAAQDFISVPWPSGHDTDDLGLLVVTQHSGSTSGVGLPGIGGFVKLLELNMDGGGLYTRSGIYWKIASSNAESDALIFSSNSRPLRGQIVAIRNATTPQVSWPGIASFGNLSGSGTPINHNINGLANQSGRWLAFDMLAHRLNVNGARLNQLSSNPVTSQNYEAIADNSAVLTGGFILAQAEVLNTIASFGMQFNTPGGTSYFSRALLMIPAAISTSPFSSSGTSTASNPGNVNRASLFSSAGVATVSNPGAHKAFSTFVSAGVATVSNPGNALARSSFNAAGTSTAQMVGAGGNASSFSSMGSSSANMIGTSTAESGFSSEGTSLALMFSPGIISSAFSSSGSSTAQMFSPNVVITTLVDGSGGVGEAAQIDHSLCDFAEITLSEGEGTYSIEHINLIAGKWVTVTLVNQNASGSLIWNNGDAPVDWSPGVAPDFPANGETLDLEFFVRRDRALIRGRRAFV